MEWDIPSWDSVTGASLEARTPDLASLINAVVSQEGWVEGNSLVFSLIPLSGDGYAAVTSTSTQLVVQWSEYGSEESQACDGIAEAAVVGFDHCVDVNDPEDDSGDSDTDDHDSDTLVLSSGPGRDNAQLIPLTLAVFLLYSKGC